MRPVLSVLWRAVWWRGLAQRTVMAIAMCAASLHLLAADLPAQRESLVRSARTDSLVVHRSMQLTGASWLMGLSGTIRPSKVAQTATLDARSNRIWEFEESSAYATLLYRRNRFALAGDLSGFRSTDSGRLPSGEAAIIGQRLLALTVTPGYAVLDGARGSLAVFGGVRIWRMSNSVSVPALELEDRARTSYYDVVLASRAEHTLARGLSVSAYADAGGFGIASDLTWQAVGTIRWRTNDTWALIAGYRHLSVDYRGDSKRVSLKMFGPTVGGSISF